MASVNRPEIFLLSLAYQPFLDETCVSLFAKLNASAKVKRAKQATGALRYLEENRPRAILVSDEGLTEPKNREVLDKVLAYIRSGGLVVVGLHFPSFTEMDDFNNFFAAFGLPWKRGDYHRTDFEFNPACALPASANAFPASYSMKVLHVKNAQPTEKIFIPVTDAQTQSNVFPPGHVDQTQAAVVGAKLGDGYLFYIGDVNQESGTDQIILSLCGL